MALEVTTAPTDTPVSLADAKAQCRILTDDSTHDDLLTRLISAAVGYVESLTASRLSTQTLTLTLDRFPSDEIDLCVYPVTEVLSVKYDDVDDVEQTLLAAGSPTGDYWASLEGRYPKVRPVTYWPYTRNRKPSCVRIQFKAGYLKPDDVPQDLRHAVLVKVKELFDHGGESVTGMDVTPAMNTVKLLTDLHRRLPV